MQEELESVAARRSTAESAYDQLNGEYRTLQQQLVVLERENSDLLQKVMEDQAVIDAQGVELEHLLKKDPNFSETETVIEEMTSQILDLEEREGQLNHKILQLEEEARKLKEHMESPALAARTLQINLRRHQKLEKQEIHQLRQDLETQVKAKREAEDALLSLQSQKASDVFEEQHQLQEVNDLQHVLVSVRQGTKPSCLVEALTAIRCKSCPCVKVLFR